MKPFEYHEATTLAEASAMLLEFGNDAYLLAGGTDLFVEIKENTRAVTHLINIKKIPDIADLEYDEKKGLRFGALVTYTEIELSPIVAEKYPNFVIAASLVGSPQIRNRATVIGNICRASPSADGTPPLIADGAILIIYSPEGERRMTVEEFIIGPGKTILQPGEIVIGMEIPAPVKNSGKAYIKLGRREAMELSTVAVAVSLEENDGSCTDVRIALAAVAATVFRAKRAEEFLRGKTLSTENIAEAAELAKQESNPISNVRASASYRKQMVGVLTRRAIQNSMSAIQ